MIKKLPLSSVYFGSSLYFIYFSSLNKPVEIIFFTGISPGTDLNWKFPEKKHIGICEDIFFSYYNNSQDLKKKFSLNKNYINNL